MAITLSLGYDHERPYGAFAQLPEWKEFRKRQMDFLVQMHEKLDQDEIPRTFFILGEFLNYALEDYTAEQLREIHQVQNPLVEIQQHSYSHPTIRSVGGREDKQPVTPKEFITDIRRASKTLREILGVTTNGLRTPIGYNRDLSDMQEIVEGLQDFQMKYVSSCLMGGKPFEGELTQERQPKRYSWINGARQFVPYERVGPSNLVEIPSHGWQDVFFVFSESKTLEIAGRPAPRTPEEIFTHYSSLFEQAHQPPLKGVNIALSLHPWAVMEYDPQLEITKKLADTARKQGIEIISYGEVANRFLQQR